MLRRAYAKAIVHRALNALSCSLLVLASTAASAEAQFQLGLQDPGIGANATAAQKQATYAGMQAIDGSVIRIGVEWATIAPGGSSPPAGFRASDPGDSQYRWAALDAAIRSAAEHHYRVILVFADAPGWAEGPGPVRPYVSPGSWDPNPNDFASFVHAVAVRYSGSFPDPLRPRASLPRVSYWEPWNEPNIPGYFSAPHPIDAYRTLLDRAYAVLKAIHRNNLVVLGGLAPVSPVPGSTPPLDFGADLLCLHRAGDGFSPNHSCRQRADFDIFGMHPYSLEATPTEPAYKPGDVLVANMDEVAALVQAANRFHTAVPTSGHKIWVTEFAWPTNPPDSELGDPQPTAARYVAYSMYEMWKSGVSLVIWLYALDEDDAELPGAGLYLASGQPKLTLQAFAFPVVASVSGGHGFVWGRAPVSHSVRVVVQVARGRGWRTISRRRTAADGVFLVRFGARSNGLYRAHVVGGPTSLAYNSLPIPARLTHAAG